MSGVDDILRQESYVNSDHENSTDISQENVNKDTDGIQDGIKVCK